MIRSGTGVNIEVLAIRADNHPVVQMIEGGLAEGIRFSPREQRPGASSAAVGHTFADPDQIHGGISSGVAKDIDRTVRTNSKTFHAAAQPVVERAIQFGARRTTAGLQVYPVNVSIDFEVIKLVVPWIFGKADRICAASRVHDQTDLKIWVKHDGRGMTDNNKGGKKGGRGTHGQHAPERGLHVTIVTFGTPAVKEEIALLCLFSFWAALTNVAQKI